MTTLDDDLFKVMHERDQLQDASNIIDRAEALAKERADGHLTIMRFTTGWKAVLGTPDLTDPSQRDLLTTMASARSASEACLHLLIREGVNPL